MYIFTSIENSFTIKTIIYNKSLSFSEIFLMYFYKKNPLIIRKGTIKGFYENNFFKKG